MNELSMVFEQEVLGKQFRVYGTTDEPLFLAKDVAEWIDYAYKDSRKVHRNITMMLSTVDDDEKFKSTLKLGGKQSYPPSLTHGGMRKNVESWFLTEEGLYEVLMLSRKPIAKQFKKKVKEILKDIRKHGIYATDKTLEDMLTDPDFGIRVLTELKKEREERIRAEEAKKIAEQKIEDDKPLVDFANHVNDTDTLITVGKMAKLLCDKGIDIGRNRLFDWMRDNGILMLDNTPYQRFINEGIFKVKEIKRENQFGKEFIYPTTYVTGKGQLWLYKKLVESMA